VSARAPEGDTRAVASQPETLVREYRHERDYQRDAARLQQAGWEVVSLLERPALPGWLQRATGGRAARRTRPKVERLVTYVWLGRGQQVRNPTTAAWPSARGAHHWRWWLVLVILLLLLLVLGLLNFFGDTLLPGMLALAVRA
jgi:hypothetical protein